MEVDAVAQSHSIAGDVEVDAVAQLLPDLTTVAIAWIRKFCRVERIISSSSFAKVKIVDSKSTINGKTTYWRASCLKRRSSMFPLEIFPHIISFLVDVPKTNQEYIHVITSFLRPIDAKLMNLLSDGRTHDKFELALSLRIAERSRSLANAFTRLRHMSCLETSGISFGLKD